MSLLAGIADGLMGAGQAVGRGLYAQAQILKDDERERMRQASLEKRWAREDAREAKLDKRYEDNLKRDDARYKDTLAYRESQSKLQSGRESRAGEKQDAMMLGQSLDRLDKMKSSKEQEIAQMFTDPMTKQIIDQEGYQAAMSALQQSYLDDASKIVQRSGLSDDQINKYGFSMYLPEPVDESPEPITPEPQAQVNPAAGFDVSGWANAVRNPNAKQNGAHILFGNGLLGKSNGKSAVDRAEDVTNDLRRGTNQHYSANEAGLYNYPEPIKPPQIGYDLMQKIR